MSADEGCRKRAKVDGDLPESSGEVLRGFTSRLLGEPSYGLSRQADIETLPSSDVEGAVPGPERSCVQVSAVPAPFADRMRSWLLSGLLLVSSLVILCVVVEEWRSHSSQRIWLLAAMGYYISFLMRQGWFALGRLLDRTIYLTVWVERRNSRTLFEGVTEKLQAAFDSIPECASRDVEVFQAYDKSTRASEVKLRFWGRESRDVTVLLNRRPLSSPGLEGGCEEGLLQPTWVVATALRRAPPRGLHGVWRYLDEALLGPGPALDMEDGRQVTVTFTRDGEVMIGRDFHAERKEGLLIRMRSTPRTLIADKVLVRQWCEECMQAHVEPPASIVEVYGLQQSSSEWIPEWHLERTRLLKDCNSAGDRFYLERQSSQEVLFDAKLWASSSLRIYMMLGPPGVGKSEFTVWLAGQLRLPIYRVSVNNPKLDDALLAQVFSQSWLKHDSIVVQLDEFQGALERWEADSGRASGKGITHQGLCEVLQGSTTLSRGVVVVTGMEELGLDHYQEKFSAVYRRFTHKARIDWLGKADIRVYFRAFLREFVPANSSEEWCQWEDMFVGHGGTSSGSNHWTSRPVSLDMLKQFLMNQVTKAAVAGMGRAARGKTERVGDKSFLVDPASRAQFRDLVCNQDAAGDFLARYAPVGKADIETNS
jgi:hypothetical protein